MAVLDIDALAPWLGDMLPAGTGLLNFFYLDSHSDACDPAAVKLAISFDIHAPEGMPSMENLVPTTR